MQIDAEPAREETLTHQQIDTGWELHSNRELARVFATKAWRNDLAMHREIIKRLEKIS